MTMNVSWLLAGAMAGGLVIGAPAQTAAEAELPMIQAPAAQAAPAPDVTPAAKAAVTALENVCLPLLRGGNLKQAAAAGGFREKDGAWIREIEGSRRVELQPPTGANPHVCLATVYSAVGGGDALRAAIDAWAKRQLPPLAAQKVNESEAGPNYVRSTSTWSGQSTGGEVGVVLSEQHTRDGLPAAGDLDRSTVLVSLTPS